MNEEREHDLNALAAHLEGRLEGEERQRTIEHLGNCLQCRETAALLSRSWPLAGAGQGRGARRGIAVVARSPWLGLAAVVVVATAVAIRLLPTRSPVSGTASSLPAPASGRSGPASPPAEARPTPPVAVIPMPTSSTRSTSDAIDERLLTRRGGTRRVAGKTFRIVGGEWVDSSFDTTAGLPVVEVASPGEREQLLSRLPGLAPYLTLGDRVVVVYQGTVYRSRPAPGR